MGLSAYNIEALTPHFTPDDIVLVAPLHWGLGHASRCIPIIHWLKSHCREVIIASDGAAYALLRKEFPNLKHEQLASYDINYTYENILVNLALGSMRILKAVYREHRAVDQLIQKHQITKILSDNRLGLYHPDTVSLYMTHQVNLIHPIPWIGKVGSWIHRWFMRKYHHCLIPDYDGNQALCPELSHGNIKNATFIGPITRIRKLDLPIVYDITVLLSGPEPQRTILEKKLLSILVSLKSYKIIVIRGTETPLESSIGNTKNISIFNFSTTTEIEQWLNSTKLLIARSGYSTVMDIHQLDLKALWIPTPGQTEQVYLARRLSKEDKYRFLEQKDLKYLEENIKYLI